MSLPRIILAIPMLAAGACSTTSPLSPSSTTAANALPCASDSVVIAFDFDGASQSRCVVRGERAFTLMVEPEHPEPINGSPWYAFRYEAEGGEDVQITLSYDGASHRYPPEWRSGGELRHPEVSLADDGQTATFAVPPGSARVSAQEIFDGARHAALLAELDARAGITRFTLGHSRDGRPVEGLRMGDPAAPNLIVLLGRAHPPEVSGAVAMESFLREFATALADNPLAQERFQLLAVPLLNPDGVARGHWRANMGGVDLNRDWGIFAQPETSAVKAWLDALPGGVAPFAMVDFHSTSSNLFYVQGEAETDARQEAFLDSWLAPLAGSLPGFEFTIERRNANPGSGTSKNWFHQTYAIPAYTYEAADEADRAALATSARVLAQEFLDSLLMLSELP